VAKYRETERTLGCGFVGLLPNYQKCGNRLPRLSEQTIKILDTFIDKEYEQHKQKNKREVYGELVTFCKNKGLPTVPSYKTFVAAVNRRPRAEQVKKRAGHRAAYPYEPMYLSLSYTLPRHGDRPFEIVHIDHTQLDVELIDPRTGHQFGRPWATFLTDAFSRRLLAVYLTFDEPSYRSCMMVLRECVHRYNRFPELVVVDWGPEFESIYFETLLARYECSKATRPQAKPRFGSVIERLFNTANTTFVHNLAGNTQVMKNVRHVTKSVDPREHAIWTLSELYTQLRQWAYEIYDTKEHETLGQTPKNAFETGLLQSGLRHRQLIPYDNDFIQSTLPTTRKRSAKLVPGKGVKINSLYYWAKDDVFRDNPELEGTHLPVRYDPYNVGHAFACVKGEWVECLSERLSEEGRQADRGKEKKT
jgi:transposase InsO family protein